MSRCVSYLGDQPGVYDDLGGGASVVAGLCRRR